MSQQVFGLRGLLIGRYQPFHRGHLDVLWETLERCDELIVGIGSAQDSHTLDNPFTAGERVEMILRCLGKERARTIIVPIPDINRYAIWVSHVESLVPPFEVVFSNNSLTKSLFEEAEYKVFPTKIYDRSKYSGSEIRERMLNNRPWEDLVPEQIVEFLKGLDAAGRLSASANQDE